MQNNHAFDGLIYYTNGTGANSLHFCHLYCTESVIEQQFIEKIYGQTNLTYNIDGNIITLDELDELHLGMLIHFFEVAAATGGYLLHVNPFDQPGVNTYKDLLKKELKKGN